MVSAALPTAPLRRKRIYRRVAACGLPSSDPKPSLALIAESADASREAATRGATERLFHARGEPELSRGDRARPIVAD